MRQNRKCICCSKTYSYCPSCSNADKLKPSWYSEFCCEECKELWYTATRFNMGTVTKEDAAKILASLKLKDKSEYVVCIQRDIENILKEEPKLVVEVEVVTEEEIKPVLKKQAYKKKNNIRPIEHEVVTIE